MRKYEIKGHVTEKKPVNPNLSRRMHTRTTTDMVLYHVQDVLSQSSVELLDAHLAKIMQTTASFAAYLQGRILLEALTGETPDISQYLDFFSIIGYGSKKIQDLEKPY